MFTFFFGFICGIVVVLGILTVIFFTLYFARKDYREVINKFSLIWYNRYKKWKLDRRTRRIYKINLGK
jgi:succinate dehydrogenase hydrophobic anchor subunit